MTHSRLMPLLLIVALGACADDGLTRRAPLLEVTVYTPGASYDSYDEAQLLIDLGEVPVFASKWAIFHLSNPTQMPLNITAIDYDPVTGQRWHEARWLPVGGARDPARPFDSQSWTGPLEMPPMGEYLLGISYAPLEEGEHSVVATLRSDASNGRAIEVRVEATAIFTGAPDILVKYTGYEGPAPADCTGDGCIIPQANALSFGNIGLGAQGTAQLVIKNTAGCQAYPGIDACSLCELTVQKDLTRQGIGLGFKAGTNDEGHFAFAGSTATPFTIREQSVDCGESGEVRLLLDFHAPEEEGEFSTVIVIESNDPDEPLIEIPVVGFARNAPLCVAKFREFDPLNPTAPFTDPADIRPLEKVYFDGRDSYDPRDPSNPALIGMWQWEVLEFPNGTNPADFQLHDDTTSLFDFWLPLAGHYVVGLTVWNTDGIESGETEQCRVEFDVIPGSRLHVQLTWDDPSNDQDLHLMYLAQTNTLCAEPGDCYFSNKEPVWFSTSPAGSGPNPRLDIDDVNGLGPENTNIDSPQPGTYRVAVHYWAGTLSTRNTVRIYLNGVQVAEYRRTMTEEKRWDVADITWTSDGTGYVTPYPSDVVGETGAISTFTTDSCW